MVTQCTRDDARRLVSGGWRELHFLGVGGASSFDRRPIDEDGIESYPRLCSDCSIGYAFGTTWTIVRIRVCGTCRYRPWNETRRWFADDATSTFYVAFCCLFFSLLLLRSSAATMLVLCVLKICVHRADEARYGGGSLPFRIVLVV